MSLVKHSYPTASCAEDSISCDDGSTPYPYCQPRLGAHRWLTFFGSRAGGNAGHRRMAGVPPAPMNQPARPFGDLKAVDAV